MVSSPAAPAAAEPAGRLTVELLGNDRPGLVKELTSVFTEHGLSIEELETGSYDEASADEAEKALVGKPWSEATVRDAMAALGRDFTPLTDWRATAEYRQLTAKNLLTRFFLETAGEKQELARFSLEEA